LATNFWILLIVRSIIPARWSIRTLGCECPKPARQQVPRQMDWTWWTDCVATSFTCFNTFRIFLMGLSKVSSLRQSAKNFGSVKSPILRSHAITHEIA
jgi:hypothetical protein